MATTAEEAEEETGPAEEAVHPAIAAARPRRFLRCPPGVLRDRGQLALPRDEWNKEMLTMTNEAKNCGSTSAITVVN